MVRLRGSTAGGAHAARRTPVAQARHLVLSVALLTALVGCLVTIRQSATVPSARGASMILSDSGASRPAPAELHKLVVYGHSIPSGVGASRVSRGYAVLAAEATGLQLVNHAYGGTGTASAARIMTSAPPASPKDVVVVHTGLNELFRRGKQAIPDGRAAIRTMLTRSGDAGRRVLVLECQPSSWSHTPPARNLQAAYDAWNAMLRDVAAFWRDVDVLDTCATWNTDAYTDASHYHPNDAGHALLGRELAALLRG